MYAVMKRLIEERAVRELFFSLGSRFPGVKERERERQRDRERERKRTEF